MKKQWLIILWLSLLFAGIFALFWYNEWMYNLPTPVPANYKAVKAGEYINVPSSLNSNSKPVFLHFFNPDCPCSRFNMPHFKSLVQAYSNKVSFGIVVMNNKNYTAKQIQEKYDLNIPVFFDASLAASCGVYSTPQAAIINVDRKLYYRGNYNRSRYCTDKKSNYAQMALDSLLQNRTTITFNQFAFKAYGCQLPKCTR